MSLFTNFILFETVSYQNFSRKVGNWPLLIFLNFGSISYSNFVLNTKMTNRSLSLLVNARDCPSKSL